MLQKSKSYQSIAQRLINKYFTDFNMFGIKVGVLVSDEEKTKDKGTKIIFGQCHKATEVEKLFSGYDFIITVYEINVETYSFNKEQKELLIYHELKHCGVDNNGQPYIKSHDIEEFEDIIENYGMNWQSDYKGYIGK